MSELFKYWANTNCSQNGFETIGRKLANQFAQNSQSKVSRAMAYEFESFYDRVVVASNVAVNFNSEIITLTGTTFRDLMEEGSQLVIQNMDTIKEACLLKWDFHSAFFFAGTVATTIGYGYLAPATDAGKIFCIVFMAIGIPYFAFMTTILSQNINNCLVNIRQCLGCKERTIKWIYISFGFIIIVLLPSATFMAIEGMALWSVLHLSCKLRWVLDTAQIFLVWSILILKIKLLWNKQRKMRRVSGLSWTPYSWPAITQSLRVISSWHEHLPK